jgi:GntR family transcriptional regulator
LKDNSDGYVDLVPKDPVMPTERVVADVRAKVGGGELVPGDHLPPVTQMAAEYGVSRTTILKALALLREEGVVYTVPRWGTFVAER